MIASVLAAVLLAAQPAAPDTIRCLGLVVPISGLSSTAHLDDEAVAALRRFAAAHAEDDPRIRYVVFAPYGFDRGTTSNIDATQRRGEAVRAHLVAGGLAESRIRVIRLGEQMGYPFPLGLDEAERGVERAAAEPWASAASITVELTPGAGNDCARYPRD
jgi:hypothetical protein